MWNNPWLTLSMRNAWLAWGAQSVIALRLMKLRLGGPKAQSEAKRMVSDKFAGLAEAQAMATVAVLGGPAYPPRG